jgi:hypothetical protein
MADLTLNDYTGLDNDEIKARLNQEYNVIQSIDSSHDFITPIINSGHDKVKNTINRLNQLCSRQFISLFFRKRVTPEKQPLIIR